MKDHYSIKNTIKKYVECIFNLHQFGYRANRTESQKVIHLILTPQYLNYGDHAIAVSELEYLKKMFPTYKIHEITYSFFEFFHSVVKRQIKDSDIIVITGGGYFGDIWPENQRLVNQILSEYPDNLIVAAPQTIYFYSEEKNTETDLMSNHRHFVFLAREDNSIRRMKSCCPNVPVFFSFDAALALPTLRSFSKGRKNKISFVFRNDHEANSNQKAVLAFLVSKYHNDSITNIKMAIDHVEIPSWLRRICLVFKLKQYQTSKLVVTDRLHGMLLSAITRTPCVAFDNVSRKISGVYETIKELPYIKVANSLTDLPAFCEEVLRCSENEREKSFLHLLEKVNNNNSDVISIIKAEFIQ